MNTFRDYEKEIDDIRDQLSRERRELGKEEFDRRQAEKIREAVERHNLTYATLPVTRPAA